MRFFSLGVGKEIEEADGFEERFFERFNHSTDFAVRKRERCGERDITRRAREFGERRGGLIAGH